MQYLNIDERFCKRNYQEFAERHNHNKEKLSEKLRYNHEFLVGKLVHELYKSYYSKHKKGVTDINPMLIKLSTNNKRLARRTKMSERTIYNLLTRLIQAGFISKIGHGSARDYEIIFNPYMCPISDLNDANKTPIIFRESMQLQAYAKYALQQYLPSLEDVHNTFINKLTDKESLNNENSENSDNPFTPDFESTFVNSDLDYLRMIMCFGYKPAKTALNIIPENVNTGIEGSHEGKKEIAPGENSQNVVPKKRRKIEVLRKIEDKEITLFRALRSDNIDDLRLIYAHVLLSYALDKIPGWKEKIYFGVMEDMTLYIAENYFNECQTKADIQRKMDIYYSAIDIARKYIRKKLASGAWKSFFVFPPTYFKLNYKNGFANFVRKAIEDKSLEKDKNFEKNRLQTNRKINAILEEYYTKPSEDNYNILLSRVQNTIPGRVKQFISCIKHKNSKIENVWDKKYINRKSKTA